MRTAAASGARDGRGRFVPGMSGNPAGKKPGTLNKATLWRQAMEDGDELAGRRRMVAQMREGDQRATMYILKQIDGPDRKVAAIALPIPPGSDVATVFGSIKAKMILGEVSPDEALAWFTALEKGVKAVHDQLAWGAVDRRMDEASAAAAAAEMRDAGPADEPHDDGDGDGGGDGDGDGEPAVAVLPADPDPIVPSPLVRESGERAVAPPAPPAVSEAAAAPADDRHAGGPSQPFPTRGDGAPAEPAATAAAVSGPAEPRERADAASDRPAEASGTPPAVTTPPVAPAPPFQPPSRLAGPATPEALAAASVQPCISPAFPGRRRKILAARAAGQSV